VQRISIAPVPINRAIPLFLGSCPHNEGNTDLRAEKLGAEPANPTRFGHQTNNPVFAADFTVRGEWNPGGSLIIESAFPAAALSTVARLQPQGMVVKNTNTGFVGPIHSTITAVPFTPRV
jgi:hypothetical protein